MKQIWQVPVVIFLLWSAGGCTDTPTGEPVTVASVAERLADPLWLPRLDQPDTRIHTSVDRTGGNNDYGTFLRDSQTPGWKVLVDLKGPGFVSRVWFTGGTKEGVPHRFRFYFDDEETPRLEGDIKTLFSGRTAPFLAPLAEYNNYCWYSFVPMPYARRLRIECEEGHPGAKVYYQISESKLPRGTPVETLAWPLPERDTAALDRVRRIWAANRLPEAGEEREIILTDWKDDVTLEGPAILRRLEFEPDWDAIPEAARDSVLRDWMVTIQYDGMTNESVRVPLGDLCGVPWRRIRAHSLYFGMEGDALFCAFPMPFAKSLRIRLKASRVTPVPIKIRTWVETRDQSPMDKMGFFHASWWRSTPKDAGRSHPIVSLKGRGKFVGCLLSVCTLDNSYWALEGDETIRKDRERTPGWLGTGLEDYFNGGWYYQNVMAGPTHGLFVKEPFRAVQYRVHAMDPSQFKKSLEMEFERGPEQTSKAFFESVSWSYLADLQSAGSSRLRSTNRSTPQDSRLDMAATMTALWNYERFDDLQGERDELNMRIRRYGPRLPASVRRMLQFRLALVEEALGGPDPLPTFLQDSEEGVRAGAKMLQQQRESGEALAVFYANMPAKLFVDGREVMQAGHPERSVAGLLNLSSGRHVLVIQAPRQRYPDWVQLAIRGQDWFVGTDISWSFAFDPPGDWASMTYDDSDWRVLEGTGVKGPPEEPYIWVEPDPFLNMQSKALGLRPSAEWPAQAGTVVYRKIVEIP